MKTKIEELKEKAKTTIIGKILGEKDDKKIEPYNGENAHYSSSDEEYAEFLKNLNIITADTKDDKDVFSVESTQSFKLSKDNKADNSPSYEDNKTQGQDDTSEDDATKYVNINDDKIFTIMTSIERLTNIVENSDIRREHTLDKVLNELGNLKQEIEDVKKDQLKIQGNVAGINKVSDSVFDLKNAQQSAKVSITGLEASFNKMKNKYMTCLTLLSILSFIIIALQILNLFS